MSIATALNDLSGRINDAYTALENKGAVMPSAKTSHNLSACIDTIPTGGGDDTLEAFIGQSLTSYTYNGTIAKFQAFYAQRSLVELHCPNLSIIYKTATATVPTSAPLTALAGNLPNLSVLDMPNANLTGSIAFLDSRWKSLKRVNIAAATGNINFSTNISSINCDSATGLTGTTVNGPTPKQSLTEISCSSLTSIGGYAFANNDKLDFSKMDFSNVKNVGSYAFYNIGTQQNKQELYLMGATKIGMGAFRGDQAEKLGPWKVHLDETKVTEINTDNLFTMNCMVEEVTLPYPATKEIRSFCFSSSTSLTSVTVPNSVSAINTTAFRNQPQNLSVYMTSYTGSEYPTTQLNTNFDVFENTPNLKFILHQDTYDAMLADPNWAAVFAQGKYIIV